MARQTQPRKWAVDVLLFVGFWLCFFLDLTGLEAHQWLGVALGALAVYHLIVHWAWLKSVTQRFLALTSGQARLYYLLDASIVLGLALILASGLVISTWLNLPLANYVAWKDIHVVVSLATLLVVVAKLAAHWRWLARGTRLRLRSWRPAIGGQPVPRPAAAVVTRRDFLSLLGVLGASYVAAAASAWDFGGTGQAGVAQAAPVATPVATPTATAVAVAQAQVGRGRARREVSPSVAQATPSSAGSAVSGDTGSSTASSGASGTSASACVVQCDRHCSYPGKCRRYVDANGNGLYDLGECL
ncbi:MAG: hypothetical protein M1401_12945 [Chloroflexi bacterium]|nr:hypothetical protein [Chloroflexota bacterium]